MTTMTVVRSDGRGRVTLPKEIRKALNVREGDVFFLRLEEGGAIIRLAKAENPFEADSPSSSTTTSPALGDR